MENNSGGERIYLKLLLSVIANHKTEQKRKEFKTAYRVASKQSQPKEVTKPLSKKEELQRAFSNPIFVYDLREHKVVLDHLTEKYVSI